MRMKNLSEFIEIEKKNIKNKINNNCLKRKFDITPVHIPFWWRVWDIIVNWFKREFDITYMYIPSWRVSWNIGGIAFIFFMLTHKDYFWPVNIFKGIKVVDNHFSNLIYRRNSTSVSW